MRGLSGKPDGGHWIPYGGALWRNATVRTYAKGTISALSCVAFAATLGTLCVWERSRC